MIKDIKGFKIFNSRGESTILIKVTTDKGVFYGSAPSGASKGKYEAKCLDIDKSLKILETIKENFIGLREEDFDILDDMIVQIAGENFQYLGAHLGFALSSAFLKAATQNKPYKYFKKLEFPYPIANIIGGGKHGGGADIQEFLVLPLNAKSIYEAVETCIKIWNLVREEITKKGKFYGKNDENAIVCDLGLEQILEILSRVAGDFNAKLGLDLAASSLFDGKKYVYEKEGKSLTREEQIEFVKDLIKTWNLYYIEDPFHEDDFQAFAELRQWKKRILVCGDDLFATKIERLKLGIEHEAANCTIIKPNQAGTIGLAIKTAKFAKENGIKTVLSHRSGETTEWIIADLALGLSEFIKTGTMGGERLAKLNRLLELWEEVENPKMVKI